jgi:hypothetical protein
LRKKRDKSFRRVLEVIRGPNRFKTDGVAFHSFASVSTRIFFKEARFTGWLVVKKKIQDLLVHWFGIQIY